MISNIWRANHIKAIYGSLLVGGSVNETPVVAILRIAELFSICGYFRFPFKTATIGFLFGNGKNQEPFVIGFERELF